MMTKRAAAELEILRRANSEELIAKEVDGCALSRLENRGYLRRPMKGVYLITAAGKARLAARA